MFKQIKIKVKTGQNVISFDDNTSDFQIQQGETKEAVLNDVIRKAIKDGILVEIPKTN